MFEKQKIIVIDAMGGDHAPAITVDGTCQMAAECNAKFILLGDEVKIQNELRKHKYNKEQIIIEHTPDEITMEDSPKIAIKEKPNASVLLASKMLSEAKADAMVSAGSTGAVILSAATHIKRIPGVKRTALGTLYPTLKAKKDAPIFSFILDVGANVVNSPEDLVHFAYMGISYVKEVLKIENPSVGLLNIGAEAHKGNETMKAAYKLLSSRPDINFIGNIEGNDLSSGKADVVVTEGMTGNIAMKTMEGMSETVKKLAKMALKGKLSWKLGLLFLSGGIKKISKLASYQEYGGAPIFGFDKLVVKGHGRSDAYAFKNCIRVALEAVENDMIAFMRDSIAHFEEEINSQTTAK
ncbi:MAG: phosphate acyltransferase PlsX [Candidatus Neomarinimicrobiota bacterium]